MKKLMAMVALLGLSLTVSGKTEFSKFVEYVQTKYADEFKDYPILIFDMDEIEYRYAKANVFGDTKES